ncbi:hypothetical protein [[Phormidium ambiguum] IAM M-71]|nr:hypothetical protein [Phormidium ambiguum]
MSESFSDSHTLAISGDRANPIPTTRKLVKQADFFIGLNVAFL